MPVSFVEMRQSGKPMPESRNGVAQPAAQIRGYSMIALRNRPQSQKEIRIVSPSAQPQIPSKPSVWFIATCLLAVYVIWGTTYYAIKVGIEGAPPFFLVATRFAVAGAVLLAWQGL